MDYDDDDAAVYDDDYAEIVDGSSVGVWVSTLPGCPVSCAAAALLMKILPASLSSKRNAFLSTAYERVCTLLSLARVTSLLRLPKHTLPDSLLLCLCNCLSLCVC